MTRQHSQADADPGATPTIEAGEFPFPLTGGAEESPYLVWLRNHSNYMAARGLFDYLRMVGVLARGTIVNFLIFLPYLLLVAIGLAYAHHWMLAHPFRLTLGVLGFGIAWILIFPVLVPLFKITTYRRSLETGNESSVRQRDLYERSFGAIVLGILGAAALESLPWTLEFIHDQLHQGPLGWHGGLATVSAGLALLGSANRLLSALSGAKKTVAMVLVGLLGLLVPLTVILYTTDFLIYSLPPSPSVGYSPLLVPVIGVLGILIAIPLGLGRRSFTRTEFLAVAGLLVLGSTLVLATIKVSRAARTTTAAELDTLDATLQPITEIASHFGTVADRPGVAADVAALVRASATVHGEYTRELGPLRELRRRLQQPAAPGDDRRDDLDRTPRSPVAQWFDRVVRPLRQFRDSLRIDDLKAEGDRRYFAPQLILVTLAHKLSELPDTSLAPLRRELASVADAQLLGDIWKNDDATKRDDHVAAVLRSTLAEHYLWASRGTAPDQHPEEAIRLAAAGLQQATVRDIAILISEEQLFRAVKSKFREVPGKAESARLASRQELTALLTDRELLDLVIHEVTAEIRGRIRGKQLPEDALPYFPGGTIQPMAGVLPPAETEAAATMAAEDVQRETLQTAHRLAGLVKDTTVSDETFQRLAFYYSTGAGFPPRSQQGTAVSGVTTAADQRRTAGERLANRALDGFDVDHLIALAFMLGGEPAPGVLQSDYDSTSQDREKGAQLHAFLEAAKRPLGELVDEVFASPPPETTAAGADSSVRTRLPYQFADRYRSGTLLAARALGNDTDALARLARMQLIERVLAPDEGSAAAGDEQRAILEAFGTHTRELLGNDELARIAIARVLSPAIADDLITTLMLGVHGRLDRGGLAKVTRQVTDAVMLPKVIFVALLAVVIWFLWWLTADVNLTSIHGLYRDRLASAFLVGKDTKGNIDIEDDIDLDDICRYEARSVAPYHLINVALNLQGSHDIGIRGRQSDFFIFSKRFTGGQRTGYCRSTTMEQVFPQMDVATAMAISAAAASPNMGRGTSPFLVAFMTLLNVRLGYWAPNPGLLEERLFQAASKQRKSDPRQATRPPGFTFAEVFAAELQDIESRWGQVYPDGAPSRPLIHDANREPTADNGLVGIGFSGGGIRSASLNLGITQALHQHGVFDHLDYMSTVSGGGYLGSSISTLMRAREKLFSEIAGTVTIGTNQDEQIVTVTPSETGEVHRTYRFTSRASLNVRHLEQISAGTPLLKPRTTRGRSDIAGTVTIEEPRTGARILRVQGSQSDGHRDYPFSRLDSPVKTGGLVKAGDELFRRHDTLGGRFSWRVRPTAFLREMLSRLDEKHRWVNLSDGGHIENMAAIELLRRRCRYIIIGDGEADPQLHFAGLATLMRYAQIDLGIRIEINLDRIRLRKSSEENEPGGVSAEHWAIGTITYPPSDGHGRPETGYLLYLKSSFSGDESEVIREYRHRNPDFPHQSTADQFFDEDQFEAYRALGQHIAEGALGASQRATPGGRMSFSEFEAWFARLQETSQRKSPAQES